MFEIKGMAMHCKIPNSYGYDKLTEELDRMGYVVMIEGGKNLVVGKKAPASRGFAYKPLNKIPSFFPMGPEEISPKETAEIQSVLKKYGARV